MKTNDSSNHFVKFYFHIWVNFFGVAQPKLPSPGLFVLCSDLLALQLFDSPKDLEPTLVVLLQESPERPRQASPFGDVAHIFQRLLDVFAIWPRALATAAPTSGSASGTRDVI